MSYVRETLAPMEEILTRARFNWTYSFTPVLWGIFGAVPMLWLIQAQFLRGVPLGNPLWVVGGSAVPLILGLSIVIAHFVHLGTTEIVVTNGRFVYKTGLVSRQSKEVSLNKIEEINLQQSILGRLFGYGHLTLRGTGVGVIELPDIDDPVELRRKIEGAKARLRQAPEDREGPQPMTAKSETATTDKKKPARSRLMKRDAKGAPPDNLR